LLSKDGLFRGNVPHWRDYKSPEFHPNQQDDRLSRDWLEHNQERFTVVGQSA
jgi:predicted metal-dependent hydrolase